MDVEVMESAGEIELWKKLWGEWSFTLAQSLETRESIRVALCKGNKIHLPTPFKARNVRISILQFILLKSKNKLHF